MIKTENSVIVKNGSSLIPTFVGLKTKFWLYSDVALVFLLIFGVWSLVSLPIIIFHLPKSEITSNTSSDTNSSGNKTLCSAPLRYNTTSHICLTEFSNILRSSHCSPDPEGYIVVLRNEEETAAQLINGLTSLGASAECLSKAVPFFCLHLFGLCGVSGISIQPTSSQCEEIRETACQQHWMFVEKLDIGLPDCEIFPAESLSCPALNGSLSTNGTVIANMLDLAERYPSNTTLQECTGDYYQENGTSYCTQSCYTSVKLGKGMWIIFDVLTVLLMSTSFLASAAIIMISCLAHKRMLIFPAIFIVFMVIDYMALDLFILLGMMDRRKLLCTSRSLIKSLREVTPFCVIFGIVETYTKSQMLMWWLFHTANLFWEVKFPFHARSFKTSSRNKYIHITCIIVGILLPLVPIIIIMADTAVDLQNQNENSTARHINNLFLSEGLGFGHITLPTLVCASTNSDATFYSILVMIDVFLGCGCTMLIIIFWSVHKVYIKRKQVQKKVNLNINKKTRPQFTFGTAEKKLLIVLSYYVACAAIIITLLTWEIRMSSLITNNLQKFLFCELGSHNSSNSCKPDSDSIDSMLILLQVFALFLFSLFPYVNLLYVVNIQELKELWKKLTWSMVCKHH